MMNPQQQTQEDWFASMGIPNTKQNVLLYKGGMLTATATLVTIIKEALELEPEDRDRVLRHLVKTQEAFEAEILAAHEEEE